jgi:hypothetical protein
MSICLPGDENSLPPTGQFEGVGVLRLRRAIRFADVVAPLRMTAFQREERLDDYIECDGS